MSRGVTHRRGGRKTSGKGRNLKRTKRRRGKIFPRLLCQSGKEPGKADVKLSTSWDVGRRQGEKERRGTARGRGGRQGGNWDRYEGKELSVRKEGRSDTRTHMKLKNWNCYDKERVDIRGARRMSKRRGVLMGEDAVGSLGVLL